VVTRATDDPKARAIAAVAVAVLAAGFYFAIGIRWALGWPLGWIDSGLVVYGSWRVADGALPYRDFDHVYGPSIFYLNAALLRVFGADLAVIVTSILLLKTILATLVFALARRVATAPVAGATTALLIVVWGAPLWLFSAPYPQHYAVASALAGLLAMATATAERRRRALAVAGLWTGVAATFKHTSGLFALLALVLGALADTAPAPRAIEMRGRAVRTGRLAAACIILAVAGLYAVANLRVSPQLASYVTVAVVAAPFLWSSAGVVRAELRRCAEPATDAHGARDVVTLAGFFALPPLAWILFFVAHGAGGDLARDLLALPPQLRWFLPLNAPSPLALLAVVTVGLAVAAAHARRRGARVALEVLAAAVLVALGVRSWPMSRHVLGRLGFEVVAALPLLAVVIGMLVVPQRSVDRAADEPGGDVPRLYLLFAAANLLQLLPAADVWHLLMGLPAALPLVAYLLTVRPVPATRCGRALAATPIVVLAAACVPFVTQLATTREAWRKASARFARASGMTHPDPKFDDVAALVRALDTGPAHDRPVFVLTGEAMIYFLAGRPSALDHEEYLMQTLARGVASTESVALLTDDQRFTNRLESERPLVIDGADHPTRAALRRFLPRTAQMLETRYRPRATFGSYQILDLERSP
jgi:hypothetical protein